MRHSQDAGMMRGRHPMALAVFAGTVVGVLLTPVVFRVVDRPVTSAAPPRSRPATHATVPTRRDPPREVVSDFDGDGRADKFTLDSRPNAQHPCFWPPDTSCGVLRVQLASGRVYEDTWLESDSADWLTLASIAGDGRHQVFINSYVIGGSGAKLVVVDPTGMKVYDSWDVGLVSGHAGNSRGGSSYSCELVDGLPSLVSQSWTVVPRGWGPEMGPPPVPVWQLPDSELESRWTRQVYRLQGLDFVLQFQDMGADALSDPRAGDEQRGPAGCGERQE